MAFPWRAAALYLGPLIVVSWVSLAIGLPPAAAMGIMAWVVAVVDWRFNRELKRQSIAWAWDQGYEQALRGLENRVEDAWSNGYLYGCAKLERHMKEYKFEVNITSRALEAAWQAFAEPRMLHLHVSNAAFRDAFIAGAEWGAGNVTNAFAQWLETLPPAEMPPESNGGGSPGPDVSLSVRSEHGVKGAEGAAKPAPLTPSAAEGSDVE